jgi:carbamoyl-phosphate synthase large subunit
MPRRDDLESILIIGSGPIVIGQACEFDYSGTQACKALREEGYRVVLVNSNPATIMTDPETADATYIEPITIEAVTKILEKERPSAILPTLGGQTGLNTGLGLYDRGVLDRLGVEMIGAKAEVIRKAEDRNLFRAAMTSIGMESARSGSAHDMEDARRVLSEIGLPCVIRPGFTLGGTGGGIAYNVDEFEEIVSRGLAASLNSEVLIEECLVGWKEFEMEVMRDNKDNAVIICSIENLDPMGVHTGDSITVAPAQTLTDREYQNMRNASIRILREIGIECGGSNVQFAIEPKTGRMIVIEMNPRVSRSSAWRRRRRASDREIRGETGRRVHARRAQERHHAQDAGVLRADDRLHGREDPALRVREVQGRRPHAHDADEERRRDDGDRAHVQGSAAEGRARTRDGPRRHRSRSARSGGAVGR